MRVRWYGHSEKGEREGQEDSFCTYSAPPVACAEPTTQLHVAAVADGMGGHPRGSDASREAISVVSKRGLPPTMFRDQGEARGDMRFLMGLADAVVSGLARRKTTDPAYRHGPGSTLTVAAAHENAPWVVVGHIGDSRCYHLRSTPNPGVTELVQITRDHGVLHFIDRALGNWQSDKEKGEDYPPWQLDETTGARSPYDVEIFEVRTGDVILLTTDGVHGSMTDEEIVEKLCLLAIADAQDIPRALISGALSNGSTDNLTAIIGIVE